MLIIGPMVFLSPRWDFVLNLYIVGKGSIGYCPKKCVCTLTRKKRIGRCRPIPKVCNFRVPKL